MRVLRDPTHETQVTALHLSYTHTVFERWREAGRKRKRRGGRERERERGREREIDQERARGHLGA
jgi:hypothetical protein